MGLTMINKVQKQNFLMASPPPQKNGLVTMSCVSVRRKFCKHMRNLSVEVIKLYVFFTAKLFHAFFIFNLEKEKWIRNTVRKSKKYTERTGHTLNNSVSGEYRYLVGTDGKDRRISTYKNPTVNEAFAAADPSPPPITTLTLFFCLCSLQMRCPDSV